MVTELDNVKMFGDLPLETASKLLEENDFQEVLNRLPDEAFDLFTSKSTFLIPAVSCHRAPDKVHKINFNWHYLCYFFAKSNV